MAVEHRAEALQVLGVQNPPPRRGPVPGHAPAGIVRGAAKRAPIPGAGEYVAQDRQCPVGATGSDGTVVVKPAGNIGFGDRVDLHDGEERHQRAPHIDVMGTEGRWLPTGSATVPIDSRKSREAWPRGPWRPLGCLSLSQQGMRLGAGLGRRHRARTADRDAPRHTIDP
ncbi:MAG: hypothetical protein OET79_13020, partial [Nitrospirota bacterium]|nr:hypothetical protein [Nitrospirota bacterium]